MCEGLHLRLSPGEHIHTFLLQLMREHGWRVWMRKIALQFDGLAILERTDAAHFCGSGLFLH